MLIIRLQPNKLQSTWKRIITVHTKYESSIPEITLATRFPTLKVSPRGRVGNLNRTGINERVCYPIR